MRWPPVDNSLRLRRELCVAELATENDEDVVKKGEVVTDKCLGVDKKSR